MKRVSRFLLCAAAFVLFQVAAAPNASAAPILGTASTYAVLAGSTVTNTGPTVLNGNLGLYPGTSITGFFGTVANDGPGVVNGAINQTNALALQAQNDLTTGYNLLAGLSPTLNLTGLDLGLLTLTQGVYQYNTSAQLTGTLTLNAQGATNAFWVFQIGSTLTTASASAVNIINGTGAVYWQVGSSATLGTTTALVGTIAALESISLNNGATITCGGALARNGAVTLINNTITNAGCGSGLQTQTGPGGGVVVVPGPPLSVPEPGTLTLLATGLAGFVVAGWKRRQIGSVRP